MFPKEEAAIRKMLSGNSLDFYLEDDMFEIEGFAHVDNERIVVDVEYAVGHVLTMTGKELEVYMSDGILYAKRTDNGKIFQMEINRIYKKLVDPSWQVCDELIKSGVANQLFQKESDTLIWYMEDEALWYMELNKINMIFGGDLRSYSSLEELFHDNKESVAGVWQAVSYSSELQYEEKDYEQYGN